MSVGPGCTTATYIDKDCSGYGVGRKSPGVYPVGYNSTYTVGDMQDADDEDPHSQHYSTMAGQVGNRQ